MKPKSLLASFIVYFLCRPLKMLRVVVTLHPFAIPPARGPFGSSIETIGDSSHILFFVTKKLIVMMVS